MSKLKRRILSLDREISGEKSLLTQQKNDLYEAMKSNSFLVPALLGGFVFGFVAARQSTVAVIKAKARQFPALFNVVMRSVGRVLPLLI